MSSLPSEPSTHNYNCYDYLKSIYSKQPSFVESLNTDLWLNPQNFNDYQQDCLYGNNYTVFLTTLEKQLSSKRSDLRRYLKDNASEKDKREYREWIKAVYENSNHNLHTAFTSFREPLRTKRLTEGKAELHIQKHLGQKKDKNHHNPKASSSTLSLGQDNFGPTYKPMLKTGLACEINYSYTKGLDSPQELRLATQAQRHYGFSRSSPLFKEWLQVKDEESGAKGITHVYFNLLKRDTFLGILNYQEPWKIFDPAALNESWFSMELEQLEVDNPNIAVITLPAHRAIFSKGQSFHHQKSLHKERVFNELINIAMGEGDSPPIKDFYISENTKQKLYPQGCEQEALAAELTKSFVALGLENEEHLSPSQRQALWFHFTKYQFPSFVLQTLNPKTFNFTCKDGIDRGAVSSSFFNLLKSIELDEPLSEDEFYQANHAAAVMVKGRGLNFHQEFLFNALYHYVLKERDSIINDSRKAWLIDWLSDNVPHRALTHEFISEILILQQQRIKDAGCDENLKIKGENALNLIKEQLFDGDDEPIPTSGRRLLLDSATTLSKALLRPEESEQITKLQRLATDLKKTPNFIKISLYIGYVVSALLNYVPVLGRWFKEEVDKRHNAYVNYAEQREKLGNRLYQFFNPEPDEQTTQQTDQPLTINH